MSVTSVEMEKQTWTVVKFLTDSSVAAVPTKWINDNECLWPPFPADKLAMAIKNQVINTCWPTYKIEIFRNATYGDYYLARSKSKKAEVTSDLNTDVESNKIEKRKIFKRKVISSSDSDSSEEEFAQKKFPTPPRMAQKLESSPFSGITKSTAGNVILPSSHSQGSSNPHRTTQDLIGLSQENATGSVISNEKSVTNTCRTCCPQHVDQNREILRQLFFLRSVTTEILSDVKSIKDGTHKESGELHQGESIFKAFKLPVNSEDDLKTFNDYLTDNDHYLSAELEMTKVGGNTNYEFVRRCMTLLVTNELATKYSWLGRRKKQSFCTFQISNLIITSAGKAKKAKENKETEESIKNWLKRANDRLKKSTPK